MEPTKQNESESPVIKGEAGQEPSISIISQYIKDFSFENPNPVALVNEPATQPNINIEFKVDVKNTSKDVYEVSLKTMIDAKFQDRKMFLLELNYSGLFSLTNMNQEMLDLISYVECPRMLFPFLRSIVANVTADGGFAPLYLSPINFMDFYSQHVQKANSAQ